MKKRMTKTIGIMELLKKFDIKVNHSTSQHAERLPYAELVK